MGNDLVLGKVPSGIVPGIPGLCKVATIEEIEAQGWSMNPGWYVMVTERDVDDGISLKYLMQ